MTITREIERRHVHVPVEWRAAKDGGGLGSLTGYAATFNRSSQNLGGFVEQVDPAAFNKSIGDDLRVFCRTHHKDTWLLGTTEAGTLTLTVDNVGLRYDVDLPDTAAGRDTQTLAKRGDLRYSSFAFRCIEDAWGETPDGFPLRTLVAVQLVDVAPVVEPAYLDSSVAARSLAATLDVDAGQVAAMTPDEIRAALAGESPDAAPEPAPPTTTDDTAQRDTHAVDIARRLMDWDALK